jgi:hypothetical protein
VNPRKTTVSKRKLPWEIGQAKEVWDVVVVDMDVEAQTGNIMDTDWKLND